MSTLRWGQAGAIALVWGLFAYIVRVASRNQGMLQAQGTIKQLSGDPVDRVVGGEMLYGDWSLLIGILICAVLTLFVLAAPLLWEAFGFGRAQRELYPEEQEPIVDAPGRERSFIEKPRARMIVFFALLGLGGLTGCARTEYETYTIQAGESPYVIDVADPANQSRGQAGELAAARKVNVQAVNISLEPKIKRECILFCKYNQVPTSNVLLVPRQAVNREWVTVEGDANRQNAFDLGSVESIGFSMGMNCNAEVDAESEDAYLRIYGNTAKPVSFDADGEGPAPTVNYRAVRRVESLESIMDREVRGTMLSELTRLITQRPLIEIQAQKADLVDQAVGRVRDYYKDRGIKITSCGITGDLIYDSKAIQDAIDNNFATEVNARTALRDAQNKEKTANAELQASTVTNKKLIADERAKAEAAIETAKASNASAAELARIQNEALERQASIIRDNPNLIPFTLAQAQANWDGKLPTSMTQFGGGDNGGVVPTFPLPNPGAAAPPPATGLGQ